MLIFTVNTALFLVLVFHIIVSTICGHFYITHFPKSKENLQGKFVLYLDTYKF